MTTLWTRRSLLGAAAGSVAAVALAACAKGTGSGAAGATLMLDWYPNADHAGIYGALAQGYFRAHGLDLTVQTPSSTTEQVKLVAAGKADLAISYEPDVLLARAQGIPVRAIFALVQEPLNCVIALRSLGLTHPAQLQGKKVGTSGTPGDTAILDSIVRADGGDPARVQNINVGENLVSSLLAGKVDAIVGGYWNWEAVQIAQAGHPVTVLHLQDWGVPIYDELVAIASEEGVARRPQMLTAFAAALAQGTAWARAHPSQALAALLKANPSLSRPLVQQSLADLAPAWTAQSPRYGYMSAAAWQSYATWMLKEQLLTRAVDISGAMTDQFVPAGGGSAA